MYIKCLHTYRGGEFHTLKGTLRRLTLHNRMKWSIESDNDEFSLFNALKKEDSQNLVS